MENHLDKSLVVRRRFHRRTTDACYMRRGVGEEWVEGLLDEWGGVISA